MCLLSFPSQHDVFVGVDNHLQSTLHIPCLVAKAMQNSLNNWNACENSSKKCPARGVNATTAWTPMHSLIERISRIPRYLLGGHIQMHSGMWLFTVSVAGLKRPCVFCNCRDMTAHADDGLDSRSISKSEFYSAVRTTADETVVFIQPIVSKPLTSLFFSHLLTNLHTMKWKEKEKKIVFSVVVLGTLSGNTCGNNGLFKLSNWIDSWEPEKLTLHCVCAVVSELISGKQAASNQPFWFSYAVLCLTLKNSFF